MSTSCNCQCLTVSETPLQGSSGLGGGPAGEERIIKKLPKLQSASIAYPDCRCCIRKEETYSWKEQEDYVLTWTGRGGNGIKVKFSKDFEVTPFLNHLSTSFLPMPRDAI